jgi:hypothetical protein
MNNFGSTIRIMSGEFLLLATSGREIRLATMGVLQPKDSICEHLRFGQELVH